MFWKTGASWSLAARLSVWHAASTFLLLSITTGFLYWALVRSFEREDDQYLIEKMTVLQTLLEDQARNARMIEWEVEGEAFTRPSMRVLSRVLDREGGIAVETTGMSRELPPSLFPAPRDLIRTEEIRSRGRRFRTVSAPAGLYRVQIAIDLSRENSLLAQHRRQLWLVLGFGLVASVLVGYRIGHRGIRPVREMAATIQSTSSATLDRRMETRGLPSELFALAQTFNQMLDRLEDAFSRLARFSSDIAHELRTPMNNLRLEVEVALSKGRSAEEYREALASLLEEFLRLSKLIDSLLFLARAENPQTQIRRERLSVDRELSAIREFYEAPASEAGVSLRVEAPGEVVADLDRTLFQRAVGNLIENSLAHTSRGGSITLDAHLSDGELQVVVADTGSGIPAEHLERVFDRFHRVDSGGLGLGLAIVKSIAALHGGRAEIASETGRGTRVTLVFPEAGR